MDRGTSAVHEEATHLAERIARGEPPERLGAILDIHVVERLDSGANVAEVVRELTILREALARDCIEEGLPKPVVDTIRSLDQVIDDAIVAAVDRHTAEQDHRAHVLDRITTAALSARDLQGVLQSVLAVVVETIAAVDAGIIYLTEPNDGVIAKGAFGISSPPELNSHTAEALRAAGFRGSIGVALIDREARIGVVHFASRSVHEFSETDQRLFREVADLLSIAIVERRQTEQAIASRDQFLAAVSHDLRNPLGAVMMSSTLLLKAAAREDGAVLIEKNAEVIQRAAQRMNRLLHDLLDLASIEGNRLSLTRQPNELADIVNDAVELMLTVLGERGIQIDVELEADLPQPDCDRARTIQAISNLITAALEVTESGGRVCVSAKRRGVREVQISIAHAGEPSVLVRANAYKGSGLGLSIARGIIDAQGGRLWEERVPSGGSMLAFTLPVAGQG